MSSSRISRRSFLHLIPVAALAAPSSLVALRGPGGELLTGPALQEADRHGFAGPFTPEEEAAMAASPMAQAIARLHGRGYNCAEMILLAAIQAKGLREDHLDAASVFGGGIARGDLCGFLTGGLMAIGFVAARKTQDRAVRVRISRQASDAYWDWWVSRGDVHCPGPLESHPTPELFLRMSQRTAAKLEEVLDAMVAT
jgi:C_GCAxxG_C_C family probable redox protein